MKEKAPALRSALVGSSGPSASEVVEQFTIERLIASTLHINGLATGLSLAPVSPVLAQQLEADIAASLAKAGLWRQSRQIVPILAALRRDVMLGEQQRQRAHALLIFARRIRRNRAQLTRAGREMSARDAAALLAAERIVKEERRKMLGTKLTGGKPVQHPGLPQALQDLRRLGLDDRAIAKRFNVVGLSFGGANLKRAADSIRRRRYPRRPRSGT